QALDGAGLAHAPGRDQPAALRRRGGLHRHRRRAAGHPPVARRARLHRHPRRLARHPLRALAGWADLALTMNTTFPTSTYVLHAAPIAQPELRQRVGTWLGSLAFPATFELAADRDGIRVRASVAAFEGAADGFAALTRHALLWVPTGAPPAPDRVWMLQAQSDLPTVQLGGADPFLAWAGRLRAAARALDGEVALRLTILGEDPALQSRLRALS